MKNEQTPPVMSDGEAPLASSPIFIAVEPGGNEAAVDVAGPERVRDIMKRANLDVEARHVMNVYIDGVEASLDDYAAPGQKVKLHKKTKGA